MGQRFDFVSDLLNRSEYGASASEVDTWRNPVGGMGTDPVDLGRQGGLYKSHESALKVLFGCLLFSSSFPPASSLS